MINEKELSSSYNEWRWKFLSGVDREGVDDPKMSYQMIKKEEERLKSAELSKGVDPAQIDSNLLYLRRKYGSYER